MQAKIIYEALLLHVVKINYKLEMQISSPNKIFKYSDD
jgi:hypothetical protein